MNTGRAKTTTAKTNPIPTRFTDGEASFLEDLSKKTGLSRAELIRRGVHALENLLKEKQSLGAILELAA